LKGGKKINCLAANALEEWSPAKQLHVQFLMKYLFEKFSWADNPSLSNSKNQSNQYKIDGTCFLSFSVIHYN